MKSIYYLVLLYISLFNVSTTLPQIADITRLPGQNSEQSITESAPIWISDNEILIFFVSTTLDTIYSTKSNDRGISWEEPKFVQLVVLLTTQDLIHLTVLKSNTGRILLAWSVRNESMKLIFSDDEGETWSDQLNILGGGNFPVLQRSSSQLNLTQLDAGMIILSFNPPSLSVPYYRTSIDDGLSWSSEPQLFPVQPGNSINHVSILSIGISSLIALFQLRISQDFGIYSKISSDGGITWSDTIRIVNGPLKEKLPRILKDNSGTLWLFYLVGNESGYGSYLQNDIYILKSTDSGITWIENQRFTKYIGDDNYLNISSYKNNIFLSFATERFTNEHQIAYGIPGETVEVSTPPKIITSGIPASGGILYPEKEFILRATVIDDEEVNSVKVFIGESQNAEELFDDGEHNDLEAGDGVYGNKFPFGPTPRYGSYYFMNVNKIKMPMNNIGTLADIVSPIKQKTLFKVTDINEYQSVKFSEINYNYSTLGRYDESAFLFSAGFGLSGYNFNTLWGNAQMSSSLIENYIPGKVGANPKDPYNVIYVVRSSDSPFGDSWQRWNDAVLLGADFYDGDNDGIYNPVDKNWNGIWDATEDMPDLLGDETIWCVYNDGVPGNVRTRFAGVEPQGIEIQQTIFASSLPELEDIIFLRYKITNKGTVAEVLDSVIFGYMSDPDLGFFSDDLVGCDTLLSSGFCYNNGEDAQYGINPPAFYTTLLQGPVVESENPLNIAYERKGILLGENEFTGHKNQGIISFVSFVGSDPFIGDPGNEYEMRNYMKGLGRLGNKLDPCNHGWSEVRGGVDCSKVNPLYWYSGDPVEDIGWIQAIPTDVRKMLSTGPFNLEKDNPITIIGAFVLGRRTDALNSITVARENVRRAILEYESNFASMIYVSPPSTNPINNYVLYHNYPNPFNPTTTIRYDLPQDGIVTIKLYDILGQEVTTILNEFKKADRYEVNFNAIGLASGIYFYQLKAGSFVETKKMVLLK